MTVYLKLLSAVKALLCEIEGYSAVLNVVHKVQVCEKCFKLPKVVFPVY